MTHLLSRRHDESTSAESTSRRGSSEEGMESAKALCPRERYSLINATTPSSGVQKKAKHDDKICKIYFFIRLRLIFKPSNRVSFLCDGFANPRPDRSSISAPPDSRGLAPVFKRSLANEGHGVHVVGISGKYLAPATSRLSRSPVRASACHPGASSSSDIVTRGFNPLTEEPTRSNPPSSCPPVLPFPRGPSRLRAVSLQPPLEPSPCLRHGKRLATSP